MIKLLPSIMPTALNNQGSIAEKSSAQKFNQGERANVLKPKVREGNKN